MNSKQAGQLKAAIRTLVSAEVAASWKGQFPPEDHPYIMAELEAAQRRVTHLINSILLQDTSP